MSDKVAGDAEKALGNQAYKARNFAEAITHYEKAWELNKDITYLNNLAGKQIYLVSELEFERQAVGHGGGAEWTFLVLPQAALSSRMEC